MLGGETGRQEKLRIRDGERCKEVQKGPGAGIGKGHDGKTRC